MTPEIGPDVEPSSPRSALERAAALVRGGSLDEAEKQLHRIAVEYPRAGGAFHLRGVIACKRGDYQEAVVLLNEAIACNDNVATFHGELGNALRGAGRFHESIMAYERALALQPALTIARFGLGLSHLGVERYDKAAAALRAVVITDPNHGFAHLNLAIALERSDCSSDAILHHRRAIELLPKHAPAYLALGVTLSKQGDVLGAHRWFAQAASVNPDWPEAQLRLGQSFAALDHLDEALLVLRRGLTLDRGSLAAYLALGELLRLMQRFDDAGACYERAIALVPGAIEPLVGLGLVRVAQFRFTEARALFTKVLERLPSSVDAVFGIALSYRDEGNFAAASEWLEKTLAMAPDHGEAHRSLARMREAERDDPRLRRIEEALASEAMLPGNRASLHFSLGKLYDDIADYDHAFRHYATGNELLRRNSYSLFQPREFTDYVDRIIATFTPDLFSCKHHVGSPSERPVFIVGMTRSGTTLVEQIAASHSRVHGHGELDHMRLIKRSLAQKLRVAEEFPECVKVLNGVQTKAIADEYERGLVKVAPEALRSVDKMPGNFKFLGLISLLFPNARIIHCVRDPIDTCLSSYFLGNRQAAFERDLGWLGFYYRDYRRLMMHWDSALPNPILTVPYEGLVADQALWTRKLLEFLRVPWEDGCLAFHQTNRAMLSASAWQVRRPIYASSIGRWRHYQKHLGPLFAALQIEPAT